MSRSQDRQAEYRLQYPSLLNLISVLLGSGLTLEKCLVLITGTSQMSAADSVLHSDLKLVESKLAQGQPAGHILQLLIERCSVIEIKSALELMIRYEQEGAEILQLLQLQADNCWQIYCDALRKSWSAKVRNCFYQQHLISSLFCFLQSYRRSPPLQPLPNTPQRYTAHPNDTQHTPTIHSTPQRHTAHLNELIRTLKHPNDQTSTLASMK